MPHNRLLSNHLFKLIFVAALLTTFVVGFSAISAQPSSIPSVRFVNVVPGLGDIDIYVNDVLSVKSLPYGGATSYLSVNSATANVRVTLAGLTTTLWQQPITLSDDYLTLIASSKNPLNFTAFRDDRTPLNVGSARLLVIHAIEGAPALDFLVGEDVIVSNISYGSFVNSIDVPANSYEIAFAPTGKGLDGAIISPLLIAMDTLTTHMLVLYGTPTAAAELTLKTAVRASDDAGLVRVVHGVPDAPSVSVLLDGVLVIPSLAYGEATEHLPIPVGSYSVTLQAADSGDEIATGALNVKADTPQTVIAKLNDNKVALASFEDGVGGIDGRTAGVNVVNLSADAATVTLSDDTALADELEAGSASAAVTFAAFSGEVTVNDAAAVPVNLNGGVYSSILVLADGSVKVLETSLARGIDSAPGAKAAPDVVAAAPTTVPTTTEPTNVSSTEPTPIPAPSTPIPQPTASNPTARILLDPGVNLQLREFPSADAKSLGLAPSGTVLTVNGREGAPVDINGDKIPLPDGTEFVDPATLLTDEKADLEPSATWLNITYATPDGGTITAWVNALYLGVSDPRGNKQRLANLPTIPRNQPGEAENTSITPPVEVKEGVKAIVTRLDQGVNLNIRRTPESTSEVLTRVASGVALDLVGFGGSGDWAFVRYFPLEGGTITGWASTQYLRYEYQGRLIERVEMEQRELLQPVDEATLRGDVSRDAPTALLPTQNPFKDVVVATVAELNEGIRLNVRRNPNVNAEVLANVPPGTAMVVFSRDLNSEWLEVEYEGIRGWVSVQYVFLSFNQRTTTIDNVPFNDDLLIAATGTPTATPTPAQ